MGMCMFTASDKLDLVAKVNRALNKELLEVTKSVKDIFEALEKTTEPTLHLVAPSYYLLQGKLQPVSGESLTTSSFRSKLRKYMDDKFWSSIKAFHWMASFLDPTFKSFQFIPQTKREDVKFKQDLCQDLDDWLNTEMNAVQQLLLDRASSPVGDHW